MDVGFGVADKFVSEAASPLMCPVDPPALPLFEKAKPDLKTIFQIGLHCPKQRHRGVAFAVHCALNEKNPKDRPVAHRVLLGIVAVTSKVTHFVVGCFRVLAFLIAGAVPTLDIFL